MNMQSIHKEFTNQETCIFMEQEREKIEMTIQKIHFEEVKKLSFGDVHSLVEVYLDQMIDDNVYILSQLDHVFSEMFESSLLKINTEEIAKVIYEYLYYEDQESTNN